MRIVETILASGKVVRLFRTKSRSFQFAIVGIENKCVDFSPFIYWYEHVIRSIKVLMELGGLEQIAAQGLIPLIKNGLALNLVVGPLDIFDATTGCRRTRIARSDRFARRDSSRTV